MGLPRLLDPMLGGNTPVTDYMVFRCIYSILVYFPGALVF